MKQQNVTYETPLIEAVMIHRINIVTLSNGGNEGESSGIDHITWDGEW